MERLKINPESSKIISNYIDAYNLLNEADPEKAKDYIKKVLNDLAHLSENDMALGEHHTFREFSKEAIDNMHSELLKFAEEKGLNN